MRCGFTFSVLAKAELPNVAPAPGVAAWPWNGWPNVHGIGGRITVESVTECGRNTHRTTQGQHIGCGLPEFHTVITTH
ncbi:MAG: hypothetical protein EC577_04270 [Acidithiobacillus ferrooxidans]|uniref:Uncharacterized protein n=1 Tax=Acidithiobacillus ferrooxidans TaxID=920 RepID=A0A2W1KI56_ACIFR|nr:hypothetical protein DN052_03505 [Acidithiobacillus ferrooxidans]RRN85669.1 MAG: hypothetical protein EC577_04270 [Acidithiobacillus ferrooxidans]